MGYRRLKARSSVASSPILPPNVQVSAPCDDRLRSDWQDFVNGGPIGPMKGRLEPVWFLRLVVVSASKG